MLIMRDRCRTDYMEWYTDTVMICRGGEGGMKTGPPMYISVVMYIYIHIVKIQIIKFSLYSIFIQRDTSIPLVVSQRAYNIAN